MEKNKDERSRRKFKFLSKTAFVGEIYSDAPLLREESDVFLAIFLGLDESLLKDLVALEVVDIC